MPTFSLSLAPSVNAMYRNVRGVGRVKASSYRRWIKGELLALTAQRARAVAIPVSVAISVSDKARGDLDNRVKATLDLLKRAGVIPDDNAKVVRSLSIDRISTLKSDRMWVAVNTI